MTKTGKPGDAGADAEIKVALLIGPGDSPDSLEAFLRALPTDCGVAWVAMLAPPGPEGRETELPGGWTAMPIATAAVGLPLIPDRVHIVLPRQPLRLDPCELRFARAADAADAERPIDAFCAGLAMLGPRAALALLSKGSGEGSAGAAVLRRAGALVLAAAADDVDCPDEVITAISPGSNEKALSPAGLAAALCAWGRDAIPAVAAEPPREDDGAMRTILALVREHAGRDLVGYKSGALRRRIERRVSLAGAADLSDYRDRLRQDRLELDRLTRDLLIGVAGFFRDPEAFQVLAEQVVPRLFYLDAETRRRALRLFHDVLRPDRYLFLGSTESPAELAGPFAAVSRPSRIYRHTGADAGEPLPASAAAGPTGLRPPTGGEIPLGVGNLTSQARTCRQLLERHGATQLLVDDRQEVLYIAGDPTPYLGVPDGEPSRDLFRMVDPPLGTALRAAITRARRDGLRCAVSAARPGQNGAAARVRIEVTPIDEPDQPPLLLVSFSPEAASDRRLQPAGANGEDWVLRELEQELDVTREDHLRRIRPYRANGPAIHDVVATFPDITGLKQAEGALRERNRELEWQAGLLNRAAPIFARDRNDRINFWNPAAEALYGWSAAQVLGRVTHEVLDTRFPQPLESIIAQVQETGAWRGELVHTCADGRELTIDSQWTLYRNQEGTMQAIVEVSADITEQKRLQALSEEYRQILERRVAERQEELNRLYRQVEATQHVIDRAGFAVLWVDGATGRFVYSNRRAAEMLGYSEDELLAMRVSDIDLNCDVEQMQEVNRALLEQGTLRFESSERHRDGHSIPVEVTLCPLVGQDPERLTVVAIVTDISARKCAEQELERHRLDLKGLVEARTAALAEAIDRLQTATDAAELGVWVWDLTKDTIVWDERVSKVFGVSDAERRTFMGPQCWLDRVHPEDRPGLEARITEVLDGEERFRHGYRTVLPDGTVRHLMASGQVLRDGDGRPTRVVGFLQDVTETKEKQLALRRSEQRLENILSGTDAGTWEWDVKAGETAVNERWADMIGRTLAELQPITNQIWPGLIHPGDLTDVQARVERCLAGEIDRFDAELRLRHRDGHWVWVLTRGRVVEWSADGSPLRMAGIQLDVTERKRAEQALAEQEQRFRRFFEDNGSVMAMIDPDSGRIEAANSAAVRFYGYPIERLVGMRISDINILPPEQLAGRVREISENRLSAFRAPHRLASGEVRQVQIYSSPIKVGDRSLLFSIIHDETARVEAEAELLRAKEAAEAASKAKGEFLAHMSHEIRTPMNGIMGLAELALHRPLEPMARDYLEKLHRSGRHLLDILNDILDQSRIEAGQLRLEIAPFDVQELLGGLLDMFGEVAAQKGIGLHVAASDDVPRQLLGDALRLRQVLSNLLGNAIKFTEQGEVRLKITCLGVQDSVAQLRWAVTDTGPGVDEVVRARLFTPFSQGDQSASRRYGGTGLGLSISRALAELMGGRLTLESTPGMGSTFVLELPFEVTAATSLPATPPPGPADLRGARMLVAEDHPVNRQVVADMLALLRVDATVVTNGREALDALQRECFDAVLMDIQMPEMDGLTATARLREHPDWAELPVIAITAGVTEAERAQVAAVGVNDLLAKPVSLETLANTLRRWLPSHPPSQAAPRDEGPSRPVISATGTGEALPPLAGFDSETLHKLLAHQRVEDFVQLFADSVREDVDAVARAVDAGDVPSARRALHGLRGACAFAGALALQDRAQQLSEAVKQGEPTDAPLAALQRAYRDAVTQLESLLPPASAGDAGRKTDPAD